MPPETPPSEPRNSTIFEYGMQGHFGQTATD